MSILLTKYPKVHAQTGKLFPTLSGEILEGGTGTVPEDYKGKITLIGMAWSKKAEDALASWYAPLYDKFVLKRGIMDADYDVRLCLIPMYVGLKQAAYAQTLNDLKASNRKDLYPYILFYKGPIEPYDSKLGLIEKNIPYFFLLDKDGIIRYTSSGVFTESKLEKMEEVINGL
jgi:hypothetical protein